ncbi:hypothetical protein DAI22_12g113700 [Oryza sativa Japonica Group]|nr:hypothetical protein DAI22_12g113700 [Oryza sativa Japonica Group]
MVRKTEKTHEFRPFRAIHTMRMNTVLKLCLMGAGCKVVDCSHPSSRLAARWRSNIEYMSPCSESSALVKNLDTGRHVALDGAALCFLMHPILAVHKCCSLH